MNKAPECIRCHAQMEVGFVADIRQGGYSQQNWCPGEPKSFAIAHYRCALATLMPWEPAAYRAMPWYSASATCSR
jgi:hypothetical protein